MSPAVALVAIGAHGDTAVGSRIGAFARGLTRRGWHVTVIDPPLPRATAMERLLGHTPSALRSLLEHAGVEGDVRPAAGWRAYRALRGVVADVVVVSVPPFSLLGTAPIASDPRVPLVLDYRDPWSARHAPPLLARVTRTIERRAARRSHSGPTHRPRRSLATDRNATDRATGHPLVPVTSGSRRELYERLQHADAAIVTIDHTSAVESRIPAKIYDYLATSVPLIAVCSPGAALLQIPEARRFHHIHHRDLSGLVTLLHQAMRDRATLRTGRLGEGPTREQGTETLHITLRGLLLTVGQCRCHGAVRLRGRCRSSRGCPPGRGR